MRVRFRVAPWLAAWLAALAVADGATEAHVAQALEAGLSAEVEK